MKIRIPMGIPTGRRMEVAGGNRRAAGGRIPENVAQPIQEASIPATIVPNPGDSTGNQSAPAVDAGRGGWMGGPGKGQVVSGAIGNKPAPTPTSAPTAPAESIQQLTRAFQKRPATGFKSSGFKSPVDESFPQGATRKRSSSIPTPIRTPAPSPRNSRQAIRGITGGVLAGGGFSAAVLNKLIGQERESRQEQEVA